MQKLLNVVQEFTAWCGMQINVKKIYLMGIDNDKKHREQAPAPLLTINGETLQVMNLNDACRYLGYWGTGSGNMTATKRVVRQKIIAARDLIKCHPLTPELATELFISKGMGVFYFSPGLIEWSENDGASKTTRTLGTGHGKQHALSLSSRKYMQVRKAHCTWQY